jgi:thioredoxin reductase
MNTEATQTDYDVIVVGGSYSGLAASMALGRALRKVLVIDDGKPCNMQTPHSHNFITQDGEKPEAIAAKARSQVEAYDTIEFFRGLAVSAEEVDQGFVVQTNSGERFSGRKLIFATGIRDVIPDIPGFSDCWGISALHCPYCHGYEMRGEQTGVLGNGDAGFEFASLIANWTESLTLFTNGKSTLTEEQTKKLAAHHIEIVQQEVERLEHAAGRLQSVVLRDGTSIPMTALYARLPFEQHCRIPEQLGCELTEEGYLKVSPAQRTSVPGVFACGDNASAMRTLANAVGTGTTAGMMANKELVLEDFEHVMEA